MCVSVLMHITHILSSKFYCHYISLKIYWAFDEKFHYRGYEICLSKLLRNLNYGECVDELTNLYGKQEL